MKNHERTITIKESQVPTLRTIIKAQWENLRRFHIRLKIDEGVGEKKFREELQFCADLMQQLDEDPETYLLEEKKTTSTQSYAEYRVLAVQRLWTVWDDCIRTYLVELVPPALQQSLTIISKENTEAYGNPSANPYERGWFVEYPTSQEAAHALLRFEPGRHESERFIIAPLSQAIAQQIIQEERKQQ